MADEIGGAMEPNHTMVINEMSETMNVLEIFSSIQGEGTMAGIYATFVRLAGCNLDCKWCDTKATMARKAKRMTFDEIDAIIESGKTNHVIFTGGEPLLQQKQMFQFMKETGPRIWHIETNGTIKVEPDDARMAHIVVSPKLPSAFGMAKTVNGPSAIDKLFASQYSPLEIMNSWIHTSGDVEFKFVIDTDDDVDAFKKIMENPPRGLSHHQIVLQAAGPAKGGPSSIVLSSTKQLIERMKPFLIGSHTNIRIGAQLHKILDVA